MRKIYTFLQIVLLMICATTGFLTIRHMSENNKQEQVYENIQVRFEESVPETEAVVVKSVQDDLNTVTENEPEDTWEKEFESRKEVYESLKEENSDVVGWISIEGTTIDYPVCFTPEDPEFYLHRDINKQKSSYGVPFLSEGYDLSEESNLIIAGHHMKNGSMFAPLMNYSEKEFYAQHPYIHFDTMETAGTYEVIAVTACNADGSDVPWQDIVFADDSDTFENAWSKLEDHMFYETGASVEFGEKLLVLVTCEYTHENGRLLVFAKEV